MWTRIVGSRGSITPWNPLLAATFSPLAGKVSVFSLCLSPSYPQDLNTVDLPRCTSLLLSLCSSPLICSVHSHLRKWGKIHFPVLCQEEPLGCPSWTTYSALVKQSVPSWGKILQIRVLFAFSLPSPFSPCSKRADGFQGRRWDFLGP